MDVKKHVTSGGENTGLFKYTNQKLIKLEAKDILLNYENKNLKLQNVTNDLVLKCALQITNKLALKRTNMSLYVKKLQIAAWFQ